MKITSARNPRLKSVTNLHKRRQRDAEGLLLIEGGDELALALAAGLQPRTVIICPELHRSPPLPLQLPPETELIEVTQPVFEKLAYRENPDGWLAVAATPRRALTDLTLRQPPLLLVAERVEKPGNLGAMLRTADAAGVDALIVCDPATDLANPNVVRASRGALFTVSVAQAGNAETLNWLRSRAVRIVAATPQGTLAYTNADLRGPVAFVVGAEDTGLSPKWLAAADLQVRIPMMGKVNSLNVATAAALLVYEAVRQRGGH